MTHARLRRHHVHERHRPAVQHRRAALGRGVPAGDAAVPLHPAVLRALARGPGPPARAARGAGRRLPGTSSSPSGDADRHRPDRAAARSNTSRTSSSSRDPTAQRRLVGEGVSVIAGENDSRATYERVEVGRRAPRARQLRRHGQHQHHADRARGRAGRARSSRSSKKTTRSTSSQLSGATTVLPLKHQLGEYLANRVDAGRAEAHVDRRASASCRSPSCRRATRRLSGRRSATPVCANTPASACVGLWERGKLQPAYPDTTIRADSVSCVAGTSRSRCRR